MTTLEQQHDEVDPLDVEIEFAPGWTPEPGDKVRGGLVHRDERDAGYGPNPIYTLEVESGYTARTKDGEVGPGELVAVHANRDVLRRKLTNARLEPDDEVGIKYQGPPEGTARSYRYRVIRFNADGSHVEVGYDDLGGEDGGPTDADAATQQALETERDKRDAALSLLSENEGRTA
jgi:hypothetical protein